MERMRVTEVIAARDTVVERLEDAYVSVRQKAATIDRLQRELDNLRRTSTPAVSVAKDCSSAQLPVRDTAVSLDILQPASVEDMGDSNWLPLTPPPDFRSDSQCDSNSFSPSFQSNYCAHFENYSDSRHSETVDVDRPNNPEPLPLGDGPEKLIVARQALLATLLLPANIPDDTLNLIFTSQPYTLHEFLGSASGVSVLYLYYIRENFQKPVRRLSNYRVLGQLTTYWCPEREKHGYLLTPIFTNPRVTTAHRWTVVVVIGTMNKPTECFYNKDGKWYYAGVYKETLAGRKNLSPQNLYETGQLYVVGAFRVARIGLQCVGFSSVMYCTVLEQTALGICTAAVAITLNTRFHVRLMPMRDHDGEATRGRVRDWRGLKDGRIAVVCQLHTLLPKLTVVDRFEWLEDLRLAPQFQVS
ncbi:hypothetical protein EDB19DRAFT_1829820 [Suillus lakei]|nr:hypothetical protein EDB19DRAFT_1829820 [Suillus lakei]